MASANKGSDMGTYMWDPESQTWLRPWREPGRNDIVLHILDGLPWAYRFHGDEFLTAILGRDGTRATVWAGSREYCGPIVAE
jgi:hypothetical protein